MGYSDISIVQRNIPAASGIDKYQHSQYLFFYVEQGVLALTTAKGRYIVPPTYGVLVPAETPHQLFAKTPVSLTTLAFTDSVSSSLPNSVGVCALSNFMIAMLTEVTQLPNSEKWQEKEFRLLLLIRDYLQQAEQLNSFLPYPSDKRLNEITDKLLKHPSLKSDLVSWGKFVNLSARSLSRNFKKETGLTYSQWRQKLNVQIAFKHLALGDSIQTIAKLLGYESSSAFIFMFRQQMGCSPKQFIGR